MLEIYVIVGIKGINIIQTIFTDGQETIEDMGTRINIGQKNIKSILHIMKEWQKAMQKGQESKQIY